MFIELSEMMSPGDALVITVTAQDGGLLGLTITPKGQFTNAALGCGLSLEASAAEFDAELPQHLRHYVAARKSLKDQVEAAATVLGDATKTLAADTAKKLAGKTAKAAPAARVAVTHREDGGGEDGKPGDEEDTDAGSGGQRPVASKGAPASTDPGTVSLF